MKGKLLILAALLALLLPATTSARSGWYITAYAPGCGDSGHGTASGTRPHWGTIAADPSIAFGTTMWVQGYGYGTVEDRGSAVYGSHVDVWMSSCSAAIRFTHNGRVIFIRRRSR